jgi:hypothetical protein
MSDKFSDIKIGDIIYVRYLDHAHHQRPREFIREHKPFFIEPFVLDAVGWFAGEDGTHIRLVYEWAEGQWERGKVERCPRGNFSIIKNTILELRKVG